MNIVGTFQSRVADEKPAARWHSIYKSLHEAIVGHRLAPGAKLPEDELSSIFSVSRTVIRVALHALAHDRLVRLELNRGAFVAQPSVEEAHEVFEARALVEPEVVRIAARVMGPGHVAGLRANIEQEQAAWQAYQKGAAIQLAGQFHIGVAEIADQSVLTQIVRDLVAHASLVQSLYWKRDDATFRGPRHLDILDALERGDGDAAASLMRAHVSALVDVLDLSQPVRQSTRLADIFG